MTRVQACKSHDLVSEARILVSGVHEGAPNGMEALVILTHASFMTVLVMVALFSQIHYHVLNFLTGFWRHLL